MPKGSLFFFFFFAPDTGILFTYQHFLVTPPIIQGPCVYAAMVTTMTEQRYEYLFPVGVNDVVFFSLFCVSCVFTL